MLTQSSLRQVCRLFVAGSFFSCAIWLTGCSYAKPVEVPAPKLLSTLSYPIFILSTEGDAEIISEGTELPTIYSEKFVTGDDTQDVGNISISQLTPSGKEIIADVDVPLPANRKNDVSIVVSVRVDETKSLYIKASVMENSSIKEFGPFPVQ